MPKGTRKSGTTARKTAKRSTAKKPATRKAASKVQQLQPVGLDLIDEAQRNAKIQAYTALKSAGAVVPAELAAEVEEWILAQQARQAAAQETQAQEQKRIDKENADGPWWVRNAYPAPFSIRLERQEKKKRIELKARGHRGDLFPLQDGDLDDPNLQSNLNTGFIEIVPNGEAKNILSKQTQNLQRAHVPIAILRNEKGEPYNPGSLKLEAEFNSQGVVVAYEDPSIGKQHENIKWGGGGQKTGLVRAQPGQPAPQIQSSQVAQFVPTGGNPAIISSGFSNDAQARISDDLARRRGTVPQLAVSIDPVQRT
jgi:hypothetical protein